MSTINLVENYSNILVKLFPMLQNRSKKSFIGVAILLFLVQRAYSFLTPPKYYRQYPTISFLSTLKSLYMNESIFSRTRRLVLPFMIAGHGFYASRVPLTWTLFVTDPIAAKTLLLKTENFPKSDRLFKVLDPNTPVVQFMGTDNVAVSNGEIWKKQRKVMNPAFHRAMPVKTFGSVVPDLFNIIDKDLGNGVPVVVLMKCLTLDVLGLAAFGFNFESLKGDPQGWTKVYKKIVSSVFNPWIAIFAKFDFLAKYISPERRRINEATIKFNGMIDDLTNKKRQEILDGSNSGIPDNEKDLLSLMIEADIRDEIKTTTEELRHNIALFFLAGHDTTAHTLTFCLYNLAKNKSVQEKAREEALRILGNEPVDVMPTLEELKQMDYINMVIKENLRRSGPVDRLFTRIAKEDMDLNGTIIPRDTDISVDVVAIHMDPKNWHEPEKFIPERFAEGGEHESHTGLTWIPFSNGSRQCLGMNFSLNEQRVVLSMLLRKYEIEIPKDSIHYDEIVYDKPMNFAPTSLTLNFKRRY